MSVSDADIAFACDLFADLGALSQRKMFGGLSLYHAGTIFAIVSSDGRIYVKTNDQAAQDLANDGSEQFHNMPYWSLLDTALEDPKLACDRARRFLNA